MVPRFIKEENKKAEYKKKFNDIVLYMEQMCYSFKKTPKIRLALIDAQKVSSVELKEIIEEVVINIDSRMDDQIYEESLKIVEEEYSCKRLKSLHEFIIKIEKQGGEYESYIDILLQDIKEWSDRTELFKGNVERVKRNVVISMASTVLTSGFMSYLIPKDYAYTSHIIYQVCSAVMIVVLLVVYIMIVKKLNFNWLNEESGLSCNMVDRYYELVDRAFENIKKLTWMERVSFKKAKKKLEKEITKAFPDWLRETAINLQHQTVQSSVENSYEPAPYVLKYPIRQLLVDFEQYPVGIEPYDNFLSKFELPDIHSSIKMFYCINELGKSEADTQINSIVNRNNKLTQQSEEMKNKDKIGAASFLTVIPMLIGVIKIMIDMMLMIIVFTSAISNVMNGG